MTMARASEIVQGNSEFALDLYSHLVRAGQSNLFFSPYSISSALAMTFAGARGRTGQDMASVLRFPAERDDLHAVSVSNMNEWLSALVPQSVEVFLPKFCLTEQFALADVLRSMGMASAFSETVADFSGMSDQKPALCISEVLHKAFVEVNEEGTEAAAATAITVALGSAAFHRPPPVPVFRADHPFVFVIRHNESGSILFLGRVMDPNERRA